MEAGILLGWKSYPESLRSCRYCCPPAMAFAPTLGMSLVSHLPPGMCVPTAGMMGTVESWEDVADPRVCYSDINLPAGGGRGWERPTVDKQNVRTSSLTVRVEYPEKYIFSLQERKEAKAILVFFLVVFVLVLFGWFLVCFIFVLCLFVSFLCTVYTGYS